jgi:hypothetical protein
VYSCVNMFARAPRSRGQAGKRTGKLFISRVSRPNRWLQFVTLSSVLLASAIRRKNTSSVVPPTRPASSVENVWPSQELGTSTTVWCNFMSYTLQNLKPVLFKQRKFASQPVQVALIMEDRLNLVYWWNIPWALNMLGDEWALQILTTKSLKYFFEDIVEAYSLQNVFVDTLEERFGYGSWVPTHVIHKWSFMMAKQFWQGVRGEYVLVMQDHGVPVRRWDSDDALGTLAKIRKYAYAGSPWSLQQKENAPDIADVENFVRCTLQNGTGNYYTDPGGNGGFSLRKRSIFEQFGIDLNVSRRGLFSKSVDFSALGTANEDWLWSQILGNVHFGTAPKLLEHEFSVELLKHPKPLGCHNYAAYHGAHDTYALVELALSEFFQMGTKYSLRSDSAFNSIDWASSWTSLQKQYPTALLPTECSSQSPSDNLSLEHGALASRQETAHEKMHA